jgi:hypothetical protein
MPLMKEFHARSTDWEPTRAVNHLGDSPQDLSAPFLTLEMPRWLDNSE